MSVQNDTQPVGEFSDVFSSLISQIQHEAGSVLRRGADLEDRPSYGQTLFLAECSLDMRFGAFKAYVFQDIIDKHYIIALAHGDIVSAPLLYTRIHSSCFTSETLQACDCDCRQQLEGALHRIADRGNGILFYLMQEGRGVGYVGKARDRMLVQASLDQVSTFQAYAALGLAKDHRNYENIAHICHLLGITAPFVVLTNNPDKIEALRSMGIQVAGTETLEFEPSPFNLAYLSSKAAAGHILSRPSESRLRSAVPPEPVVPFRPRAAEWAPRFIRMASYFLPIRPVDDEVLLTTAQFATASQNPDTATLILGHREIRNGRLLVRVDTDRLALRMRNRENDPALGLLVAPYWFKVHAYYDTVTSQDYVVLTYGECSEDDSPVVRLQSESLFNRFPLSCPAGRENFSHTLRHIIAHGSGAVVMLHNDGRGAGFGAIAVERMLAEGAEGRPRAQDCRGIDLAYDDSDFDSCLQLLKGHVGGCRVQMVVNSPSSIPDSNAHEQALHRHGLQVANWLYLEDEEAGPCCGRLRDSARQEET